MIVCTSNCRKWSTFTVSSLLLFIGILILVFWEGLFKSILYKELSLGSKRTIGYSMWKETPMPMYLEFYLFNLTNAPDVLKNPALKPKFVECGPYTFYEHHVRENVTINANNTITFRTKRTWRFLPERTVGSLDDIITTLNPVLVTLGNLLKYKNILVRKGVNFFLKEMQTELLISKKAREFLFEGYDDPILDLVHKLNITSFNMPYTKFGWFVDRNNSIDHDGVFNMYNGVDNIEKLGLLYEWNYENKTSYYAGDCAKVNGTTGEIWYPPKNDQYVKLFATDLCSSIELMRNDTYMLHGVEGDKYIGTEKIFDNGTLYPEMKCYIKDPLVQPSGVRNITLCKFGTPALASYAHFYQADPFYRNDILGMKPDRNKHQMYMVLEPNTGLPMKIEAQFQINLKLEPIYGIRLLENVKPRVLPSFWFRQTAEISEDLLDQVKIVLVLPLAGDLPLTAEYTGYGLLSIGLSIVLVGIIVTYRKGWAESEDEQLLTKSSF